MDDDDLIELLIRGWALLCASISGSGQGIGGTTTVSRAAKFEEYLRGEEREI